jgi:hypothetical protein
MMYAPHQENYQEIEDKGQKIGGVRKDPALI